MVLNVREGWKLFRLSRLHTGAFLYIHPCFGCFFFLFYQDDACVLLFFSCDYVTRAVLCVWLVGIRGLHTYIHSPWGGTSVPAMCLIVSNASLHDWTYIGAALSCCHNRCRRGCILLASVALSLSLSLRSLAADNRFRTSPVWSS